jgi:NodT family efflux transporter outer membrane factor (OMF) lipoprotein
MKPSRSILLGAVLTRWLAACALGPDFQPPQGPQAQHYTAQPLKLSVANAASAQQLALGAELDQAWWRLFQSEALDGVVRRALAQNRSLDAARYTLAQAQELAAAQAGSLYPQLALEGGVGRDKYGDQFLGTSPKPPIFSYFALGPTINYTLDYLGGNARSVEQQMALANFQRQQLHAAYLAVSGNAVLQSLQIASLRAQIATVQALLAQDRENLRLVRLAFADGARSRLDIVSAETQLAGDSAQLPPLRQNLSLAQDALAVLLGQTPDQGLPPEFELTQLTLPRRLPLSLPSALAHRRPDILAAEAQLHAATAAVGVASANLYPQITLSASFSQQSTDASQLFAHNNNGWSLISALSAPLLDGGSLRAAHRAALDAMQASAARYQQTVLNAFGQVADALQALEHDGDEAQARAQALQAAHEQLDLARKSFAAGSVGVLPVLDAERRYNQASLDEVRVRAQRYMDTAQLFVALGGNSPDSAADPAR